MLVTVALNIALLLLVLPVAAGAASSWNPTLLVNTEAFQTIDDDDTAADIVLRFGDTLEKTLTYERGAQRFNFNDDVNIQGTASGTHIHAEQMLTASGTVVITALTSGSATGGPNSPGTASAAGWYDPNNIKVSDTNYAMSDSCSTDMNVTLLVGSTAQKLTTVPGVEAYVSLGGASDTWTLSPTATQINDGSFGIRLHDGNSATMDATNFGFSIDAASTINGILAEIQMKTAYNGGPDCDSPVVNHVRITVYYTSDGQKKSITATGGKFGIGTTAPETDLEVVGTASGQWLHSQSKMTSSGTLAIEGNAALGGTVKLGGVTYTFPTGDGTASGKVLKTNSAGVLSWSDDELGEGGSGISAVTAEGMFVNQGGDTMTGSLRISNGAGLNASGAMLTNSNLTINSDNGAADAVLTFGNDSGAETLKFNDTTNQFELSDDLAVTGTLGTTGNIAGSGTLAIEGNAAVGGNLIIGDASADAVTVHANTWTFTSDTNFALDGGVNGLSVDTDTFTVDAQNDYVGIGTQEPEFKFDIYQATTDYLLKIGYSGAGKQLLLGANAIEAKNSGDASALYLSPGGGNVGIGMANTITPQAALEVAGSLSGASLTISSLKSCNTIDTDANGNFVCGTDEGGAGSGLSATDAEGMFVNQGGDTMTGSLTISNGAGLNASGAMLTNSNLTINSDNGAADAVLTFGNDSGAETLKFNDTTNQFELSNDLAVTGKLSASDTISGSGTLAIEGNAALGGTVKLGGVTYTFPAADGTASGKVLKTNSAGVLSWSDDSDSDAGGGISAVTAEGMFVNQGGDTMTGALAIRPETAEEAALEVAGTASGTILSFGQRLTGSGSVSIRTLTDSTTAFQIFKSNGTAPVLNVDTFNERVGIGTASPTKMLHLESPTSSSLLLKNTGANDPEIFLDSNRSTAGASLATIEGYWNGTQVARIAFISGDDTENKDEGAIWFNTRTDGDATAMNRMAIDKAGLVGIGTAAPETKLEVVGTISGSQLRMGNATTSGSIIYASGSTLMTTAKGASGQVLVSQGTAAPRWFNLESAMVWYIDGDLAVKAGQGAVVTMPFGFTATGVTGSVHGAPTGQALIFDINKDGSTIFATRPQINAGATSDSAAAAFSTTNLTIGSKVTLDIDQVGSTFSGSGLTVILTGVKKF